MLPCHYCLSRMPRGLTQTRCSILAISHRPPNKRFRLCRLLSARTRQSSSIYAHRTRPPSAPGRCSHASAWESCLLPNNTWRRVAGLWRKETAEAKSTYPKSAGKPRLILSGPHFRLEAQNGRTSDPHLLCRGVTVSRLNLCRPTRSATTYQPARSPSTQTAGFAPRACPAVLAAVF